MYSRAAEKGILQLITSNVLFGFTDTGFGASEAEIPLVFLCASGFLFCTGFTVIRGGGVCGVGWIFSFVVLFF